MFAFLIQRWFHNRVQSSDDIEWCGDIFTDVQQERIRESIHLLIIYNLSKSHKLHKMLWLFIYLIKLITMCVKGTINLEVN